MMTLDDAKSSGRATLTAEEFAEIVGVSRGLAYQMVRDGTAPGVLKLGRRRLISLPALLRWLQDGAA